MDFVTQPELQVKLAGRFKIPFVSRAGGHSLWSTVGDGGFVLDLSRFRKTSVDTGKQQITVSAGVSVKEANDATYQAGLLLRMFAVFSRAVFS